MYFKMMRRSKMGREEANGEEGLQQKKMCKKNTEAKEKNDGFMEESEIKNLQGIINITVKDDDDYHHHFHHLHSSTSDNNEDEDNEIVYSNKNVFRFPPPPPPFSSSSFFSFQNLFSFSSSSSSSFSFSSRHCRWSFPWINFVWWCLLFICFVISPPVSVTAIFYQSFPNARDCFYINAASNEEIIGSFETFSGSDSLLSTLRVRNLKEGEERNKNNMSSLLYNSTSEADRFHIPIANQGEYELCFRNLLNYHQYVTFSIRAQTKSTIPHPEEVASTTEADRLKEAAAELMAKVEDVSEQQNRAIIRESFHSATSETTNSRVILWTMIQLIMVVFLSIFQIMYVKSFFEIKTIV